jgi:hypothetical protein
MNNNSYNQELAANPTPIPPSDFEQRAVALMQERSLVDDASLDRRVTAIEDATKAQVRDDEEILAKSKMLAAATIRAIERRAENE